MIGHAKSRAERLVREGSSVGGAPGAGADPAQDRIRCGLELEDGTGAVCETPTAKLHCTLVRERLGVDCDPQRARTVAEDAIRAAALVKNHPPDLINFALEMLVKSSLELPGYATLDELAARIRHDVNTAMFERVGP